MIPPQQYPVTLAARYIEPPMTTLAALETAPQRQILCPQLGRQLLYSTGFPRILHVCDKALSSARAPAWEISCARALCSAARTDESGPMSRNSYVGDNSILLVSGLSHLYYTMSWHRDIYVYQCQGMIT
jgi:hypothetical protein